MAGIFKRLWNWFADAEGRVDVTLLGFTLRRRRRTMSMAWRDVVQIEVGRKPTGYVEIFYVVMNSDEQAIIIDDLNKGFQVFANAVLVHWPQIKDAWTKVYTGPPDAAEQTVLWTRTTRS